MRVPPEVDDAPREVKVPEDLAGALAGDDAVRAAFEALPYSHRLRLKDPSLSPLARSG
jgi:uncharacterized protein YdeI (YjbR/CyaY-like superfamily)